MDEKEKELRQILGRLHGCDLLGGFGSHDYDTDDCEAVNEALEEIKGIFASSIFEPKEKPCHSDLSKLLLRANMGDWVHCHKCGNWYNPYDEPEPKEQPIVKPDFEGTRKDVFNGSYASAINRLINFVERLYKDKK